MTQNPKELKYAVYLYTVENPRLWNLCVDTQQKDYTLMYIMPIM